jgi:hypothetical protein
MMIGRGLRGSPTQRGPRRRLLVVLVLGAAVLCAPVAAWTYWTGASDVDHGPAAAGAATVSRGAVPSAAASGPSSVAVSWGASTLSSGLPVDGYLVTRHSAAGGAAEPIGPGCSGTITTQSCTETSVPGGGWRYAVTPVFASHWRGEVSARSGEVSIGTATLALAKTTFGAPLPATTTGSVTGFAHGEAISYTLNGATIAGSPATADATGAATITALTIPVTGDGPHTVRVTGASSGLVATAGILVDTVAPVVTASATPTPNGDGWNRTPVDVDGSADDGHGSGISFLKGTSDGSDPRTSPTAQLWAGVPLELAASATIKYYAVDLAGNASAVQTLEVKIDTTPPVFTIDATAVTGGAYVTAGSLAGPGVAYYRGAAAGSVRFRATMIADGGSPPASFGSSELTAVATGFTHVPAVVTTPAGGPYLSAPYSWVAGTTSMPTGTLTVSDDADNTTVAAGSLTNDSTPPAGGSVDATGLAGTGGRYSASTTLSLTLARGTDAQSGLAGSGAQLSRSSATLDSSDGVANGACGTYGAATQVGADDPGATLTDTVPTDGRCYRYSYSVPDNVGNVATYTSPDIKVQTTQPASLTPSGVQLTPVSGLGAQYVSGSTLYYRSAQAGSFTVAASASDARSGVASLSFPSPGGFTGGGVLAFPDGATTLQTTYSWSNNTATASPGSQTIAATANDGLSSANTAAFSLIKDDVAPSGGAIDATGLGGTGGRYSTSTTLSIAFAPGTDADSGLSATARVLQRASADLISDGTSNGVCATFGVYAQVGSAAPASPRSDTVPVDRTCYRYRYVVADNAGNQTTYTSADIKVQAAAPPAPALTFSSLSNASSTGTTVFYRPAATSGGFTVNAASADTNSGTTGYGFPTLASGWTTSSAGPGIQSYGWSAANPTPPSGAQTVTTSNNAGGQSSSTFTVSVSADATAPAGGSVSYTNGYTTNPAVNVSFTKGTDAGSGLAAASGVLQRAAATLSAATCGTFGAFTTVATNPSSAYSNPVTTGCYQYRYLISDNVGNQATYTSASIVKVDQIPPTNTISISGATGAASAFGGAVLYYKGNTPGSFKYSDAVGDAESGPGSADFPDLAAAGWTHNAEVVNTPTGGPFVSSTFSWTANPANPALTSIVGRDVAGKIWTADITFTNDSTAPSGGSVSYTNGVVNTTAVPITLNNGVDATGGSGVNTTTTIVKRDVAPLTTLTETCGTFAGTYATTVTLVGGADAGLSSGSCYRYEYLVSDLVGNVVTYTSASVAKVDTSGPHVTAIASLQANGATGDGQLEVGDKLVLSFNQSLAPASVPATSSGATEKSLSALLATTLTIPGITSGALSTGSLLYVPPLGTATFAGSVTLSGSGTATTLTLAVTSVSGATIAGAGTLAFTPATTIQDGGGNAAAGTFSTAGSFKLF